jgi:hypothetical protein
MRHCETKWGPVLPFEPGEDEMRTRKTGTSPSMQPDAMSQKNASGLNREIQAKIGQQLRAIYDDVVQEGVPDRFAQLLKQLDKVPEEGKTE